MNSSQVVRTNVGKNRRKRRKKTSNDTEETGDKTKPIVVAEFENHTDCRDLTQLQKMNSSDGVETLFQVCGVSSMHDIKSFASRFSSKDARVHILVNNAGLLENKRIITIEGYEMNFAVNVLGTYAMTELMLPLLEKAAPDALVITVSSGGMYTTHLTEDLQFSSEKFDGVEQYARNKRV